ncbi:MAG: response regulator transcription factor [Lachnospiraceae bacterium]|nr:response regulator transcription factor [Lachnospiraceae bacterium]MCM1231361.1 response regulator transcription factor [Ruminococcus flavefaciens]
MRLLLVEDERDLNEIITKELTINGYVVDSCFDGEEAYEYLLLGEYDGAILDIMLPKIDGFDVLERIRSKGIQTPVLFLTVRYSKKDIIRGLDSGADDYISKPFDLDGLLARIRVMLRKKVETRENIYCCGELVVNCNDYTVFRRDKPISLSAKEFQLLLYLIRNKGIVVTREQLENNLWHFDNDNCSNVIDVYIRYLRKKIDDGYDKKMIHTIRGVGYQLKAE